MSGEGTWHGHETDSGHSSSERHRSSRLKQLAQNTQASGQLRNRDRISAPDGVSSYHLLHEVYLLPQEPPLPMLHAPPGVATARTRNEEGVGSLSVLGLKQPSNEWGKSTATGRSGPAIEDGDRLHVMLYVRVHQTPHKATCSQQAERRNGRASRRKLER